MNDVERWLTDPVRLRQVASNIENSVSRTSRLSMGSDLPLERAIAAAEETHRRTMQAVAQTLRACAARITEAEGG